MWPLAIHITVCVLAVLIHNWYVNTRCNYDSSGPYDRDQLSRLTKKMDRALYSVWVVIGLSTLVFFVTNAAS